MITKHKQDRALLFDGPESEILEKQFSLEAGPLDGQALTLHDFAAHDFEDLKGIIGEEDFASILATGAFQQEEGFLDRYKSESRLKLYYIKKGNHIAIFSYGEFQPTRYQLYLEGIWTID